MQVDGLMGFQKCSVNMVKTYMPTLPDNPGVSLPEFELEKCAKAKKGKLASPGNIKIDKQTAIEELNQE